MALHRLIYASRCGDLVKEDIEDILAACRRNNEPRFITGMLLSCDGQFLQLLEGPRREVTQRFNRICADSRHHGIELIVARPIETRLFANWSMHHVATHGAGSKMVQRYSDGPSLDCFGLSVNAVEMLCQEYSDAAESMEISLRAVV